MQTYLKNGYIVSMDQQDTVFDGGGAVSYTHLTLPTILRV